MSLRAFYKFNDEHKSQDSPHMQNEACGVTFMLNSKIPIAQYAKSNAARAASPAAYDICREYDFTQRHRLRSCLVEQLDYANWKDFGKTKLCKLEFC